MSHVGMILFALMLMALAVVFAPSVLALNHGRLLRNIALWLAIFLGLALVYKALGPGSPSPAFQTPESMRGMDEEKNDPGVETKQDNANGTKTDEKSDDKDEPDTGTGGFTPPAE